MPFLQGLIPELSRWPKGSRLDLAKEKKRGLRELRIQRLSQETVRQIRYRPLPPHARDPTPPPRANLSVPLRISW